MTVLTKSPKPISHFATFNDKVDDYYRAMLNRGHSSRPFTDEVTAAFPLRKFNLGDVLVSLQAVDDDPRLISQVGYKLLDLKLVYCYENLSHDIFNFGPALIVGNDEIEKITPATVGLLQQIHYRLYLLSVMVETTLDLMQLLVFHRIRDFKKGKWAKIIEQLAPIYPVPTEVVEVMMEFHKQYRGPEFHKYSRVRGLVSQSQWTHFQNECNVVQRYIGSVVEVLLTSPHEIYGLGAAGA